MYPYQNTALTNVPGEDWKDVPGWENYFQVSNYGRIKRLKQKLISETGKAYSRSENIVKPRIRKLAEKFWNDNIYSMHVSLYFFGRRNFYWVPRLVYHCFIAPIELYDDSFVIIAKDGDGLNIQPDNLIKISTEQWKQRKKPLRGNMVYEEYKAKRKKVKFYSKFPHRLKREITQYNSMGEKIRTYPTIAIAAQKTGLSNNSILNMVMGINIKYMPGMLTWKFGNNKTIDIDPILALIEMEEQKKQFRKFLGKKVTQYNMEGERIAIYPSVKDAEKLTGIKQSDISKVLQGKRKKTGGHYWLKGIGHPKINLSII